MKIQFVISWMLIFVLALSSCSIDISQPSPITPSPQAGTIPSAVPATVRSEGSTAQQGTNPLSSLPTTTIPVTWGHLNLSGKLIYTSAVSQGQSLLIEIRYLDLLTGVVTTIFQAPQGGWIYYVTVSPDAKQLVMSYIPPSQAGSPSNRALYSMPLDGSGPPRLLITPPAPEDHYIQAEWSPDGQYIYSAHYNSNIRLEGQLDPVYDILRMRYPEGQPEKIADSAFWPRISFDSTKLVYVAIDPVSGRNELYLADADGRNPQRIAFSGPSIPEVIDAPIFSPDGKSILFSAPPPVQAAQPHWFEKLLGIQVAKAHNVPSDWWSMPVTGGVPTRLTQIQTINLFASISPDKNHMASLSGEGIFVMDLDGSNLTRLVVDPGVSGTVSWIP